MAGEAVTILMAEDDAEDRELAQLAFRECRLANPLKFVHDGMELLDYLKQRGAYADAQLFPCPGIVLLDINMPRMDGREALRAIRADPDLRHLPVVVMTSSPAEADILRSYQTGANCYIDKPMDAAGLARLFSSFEQYWLQLVSLPDAGMRNPVVR